MKQFLRYRFQESRDLPPAAAIRNWQRQISWAGIAQCDTASANSGTCE
jgi:hypothetical protein